MNKVDRRLNVTSYETDYALWCAEQGLLLRAGRFDALDRENLAEEIESLGRSDKREVKSRFEVLLRHLLKWEFQPEKRKQGWYATIVEQRTQLQLLLEDSPSLRALPAEQLPAMYDLARKNAAAETGLHLSTFPELCAYSTHEALTLGFLPGEPFLPGIHHE